ncbi:hypothetical protein CDAR_93891 [Caerostris darwini]|uniref:LIM zinc-binding domain-containing protein n=1 Tax=Caerostris darwini TaxID=1538125 RepID=A0AAV4NKQ9_9ARAC|nr:hypothetical protein CDAR_93891 [Caerostris darwini]
MSNESEISQVSNVSMSFPHHGSDSSLKVGTETWHLPSTVFPACCVIQATPPLRHTPSPNWPTESQAEFPLVDCRSRGNPFKRRTRSEESGTGIVGRYRYFDSFKRESEKPATLSPNYYFFRGEHFEIVSFAICHQYRLVVRGASSERKIHARRRRRLLLKKTSAATLVPYQKVPSREHPSPIPSYVHQMVSSNAGHFGVDRTGTLPVISPGGFHTPPPPSNCAGCGFRISDRFYLYVADRQWHSNCLKCHGCKATLDQEMSCFFRDGHIYCKEDYYK